MSRADHLFGQEPVDRDNPALLNLLCRSKLADVPWEMISDDQCRAILRGESVILTFAQQKAARRAACL